MRREAEGYRRLLGKYQLGSFDCYEAVDRIGSQGFHQQLPKVGFSGFERQRMRFRKRHQPAIKRLAERVGLRM